MKSGTTESWDKRNSWLTYGYLNVIEVLAEGFSPAIPE
jgi:hypothetical protein